MFLQFQFIHQVHDPAAGHFRPSSNNHYSTVLATTSATIRTLHFVVLRRSSNTTCCTNLANSTGSNQSTIIVDAVTVAEFSTVTTRWINRAFTVRDSSAFVITDDGCLWVGDGLLNSFRTNWTILPSCFWVEIGRCLWLAIWRQLYYVVSVWCT